MARDTAILGLNAFDHRSPPAGMSNAARDAVARRLRSFGSNAVLVYQEPIRMARAQGVWMFDADGRRYLDVYNNVPSVGHSHPRVADAIKAQVETLNTHTRYLNDVVDGYAERLLATLPAHIENVVLTCTGSEANDVALRVARLATGQAGFVVTHAAYHGNTLAVTDVSPSSRPGRPLPPHVRAVPPPDTYRTSGEDIGARFAASVVAAIGSLEEAGIGFAGLMADTVFSSDGVFTDPAGFLRPAIDAVRARGGLFIADEVQPGFGRTGEAMWGFARHGVAPDIVTMGKPMGNGFPMGGAAMRTELMDALSAETKYFNTFGGNPVAAAAGAAVLDVIAEEGLMENARQIGDYLRTGLREVANRHVAIGDVRGAGLFTGLEFVSDRGTQEPARDIAIRAINGLRDRGILVGAAGPAANILKIRPPLCFSRENADMFVDACDATLRDIARESAMHSAPA